MTCQELQELSGAYALDAITPEERRAADEHLARCPRCWQMIQELKSVADLLPLSVPMVEPSPRLKGRILASITNQKGEKKQPLPMTPRIRRASRVGWTTRLVAAAAVVMFALLSGMTVWNINLQQQITSLKPATYTIQGTTETPGATGELIYFPGKNLTMMVVRGLSEPDGARVYQGWLMQKGQPTSIGLLNFQNGIGTISYNGNIQGYDAAAISLESGPRETKDAPQGPVVATGTLNTPTAT